MDPSDLHDDHGMLRTFLAPCLLVAVSVLSLAGIGVAAANRMSAAPTAPPSCSRPAPGPPRCP